MTHGVRWCESAVCSGWNLCTWFTENFQSMKSSHASEELRIAVVGAGALGGYYGARLAQGGRDVHFLMRSDFDHVHRKGLKIKSAEGDVHLQELQCYQNPAAIGPVDLVIIAVKTTANEALLELLPPLLHEKTHLLTLQNGLGNEEFLAANFGGSRVLGGLCYVCLNRTAPGEILHLGKGRMHIGEFDCGDGGCPEERTHRVVREFKACGVTSAAVDNLATERWKKLVWNVPFNGLSIVAGGVSTSRLLEDEGLMILIRELMEEVIAAAGALGHQIPNAFIETMIEVTHAMGDYRPSSMIDFLEGREVEVESIWGEPFRLGHQAGVELGRLGFLYRLIRHLVASRGATS